MTRNTINVLKHFVGYFFTLGIKEEQQLSNVARKERLDLEKIVIDGLNKWEDHHQAVKQNYHITGGMVFSSFSVEKYLHAF